MLMSYEAEGYVHLGLATIAAAVSVACAWGGLAGAALPAMFSVGWSAAHAFVLLLRKMRPMPNLLDDPDTEGQGFADTLPRLNDSAMQELGK